MELRARNTGTARAPYGVGQHPYLAVDGSVDNAVLTVPGRTRLLTDDRGNPTGTEPVAGSAHDFTEPRAIGDLVLDTAFTDLDRDPDGRVRVRVALPGGTGVDLWAGETVSWLQAFTGDTLAPERRRRGLAVEPMSCPPGALASGRGPHRAGARRGARPDLGTARLVNRATERLDPPIGTPTWTSAPVCPSVGSGWKLQCLERLERPG